MGRPHRAAAGGYFYHVLNRANTRMTIFADAGGYDTGDREAFEQVFAEADERGREFEGTEIMLTSHRAS